MNLDVKQIRFICNNEFEPKRYERLNRMIDSYGLNREIIKFDCATWKHTITDEIYNKYVKTPLNTRLPWVNRKYLRKAELSLILNYLYNLEDIEKNFTDGIFIIFESDVQFNKNFGELPKLINTLKDNYGNWDIVNIGYSDTGDNWNNNFIEDITNSSNSIRLSLSTADRCTDSHIFSMNGIKKLLEYYRTNTDYYIPLDYYFKDYIDNNSNFKYYLSYPSLTFQMSNLKLDKSTIQDDND
jgi:hypothetical protein